MVWLKVENASPEIGELVWVYAYESRCLAYYGGKGIWMHFVSYDSPMPKDEIEFQKGVTHWHPCPLPPEKK